MAVGVVVLKAEGAEQAGDDGGSVIVDVDEDQRHVHVGGDFIGLPGDRADRLLAGGLSASSMR